ncbi:MAG: TonB-dependent receptor, partial [Chitinophagaceae bacterium]
MFMNKALLSTSEQPANNESTMRCYFIPYAGHSYKTTSNVFPQPTQSRSCVGVLLTALLLIFAPTLNAQVKVQGTLTDSSNGKPVAFATVGLYHLSNTEKPLQNIFSSRKGEYEFTRVAQGTYVIIATSAGYAEKETQVTVDSTPLNVAPVTLAAFINEMTAVKVTAAMRKPLIEQEDEKLIFNAEADPSLEGLTAIDVLRKTPFLSVDGDGQLSMNGKTSFKVLLNGKETAMFSRNVSEALKSFPASMIKSVEVITNPSAKYDGEGVGGIINIVTQKKVAGYNGNLGLSATTLNSTSVNSSLNVKYGKFGLSGYYSAGISRSPVSYGFSETESLNPVAYYKRISNSENRNKSFYNFGSIELSMDIDSLNTLSTYFNLNGWNGRGNRQSWIEVIAPDQVSTHTDQLDNNSRYRMPSYSGGSDYVHKSGRTAGKEIAFKIYLDHSMDINHATAFQEIGGIDRFIRNDNESPGNSATFETNFIQPFTKGRKLEAGLKFIHRDAESDYTSLLKFNESDEYFEDKSNTNNFHYNQQVYSAYATYSFKWKDISFKVGSRVEQTHVEGIFINTGTRVRQDYLSWLPNLFVSKKVKKIHTFTLAFGRRLRRPYIWDLNPFVSNIDSLNIRYGNPDLGPEMTNTG